jgi:immune inhibitor A
VDERRPNRTGLIAIGGGIAIMACCVCIAAIAVCAWGVAVSSTPEPTRAVRVTRTTGPRATPTSGPRQSPTSGPRATPTARALTVTPSAGLKPPTGLRRDPAPPEAMDTAKLLQSVNIPERDLRDVTQRLADPGVTVPEITRSQPWNFKLGDKHSFWVSREDDQQNFWITATLTYVTPHTYFWVEDGVKVNLSKLKAAADRFENKTYPTDREFFGSEWTPGIDADPHLSLLISDKLGAHVAGYYSSMDEHSRLAHKYSNEMEMFYISAENGELGTPFFDCVLAHEFQHMIHWYHHSNQANWINEGLSELACQINDLETGGNMYSFADKPDTQLDSWPDETGDAGPNYGASYLFMTYFLDRFGKQATQALVADSLYSYAAVQDVLSKTQTGLTFDDVFADWVVANVINDPSVDQGQYAYMTITPPELKTTFKLGPRDYPGQKQTTVSQYAADTIDLQGSEDVQVDWAGATVVSLADTNAHSGKYLWWGARANSSDTTLTREFDLTRVKSATLTFWTWYDIEKDWDYAYVEASTDGKEWDTLPGPSTTNDDPNGANYTDGYTGKSGVAPADKKTPARWIQEKVDLSQYAGKKVQIRFEYITDAGVTHAGFFLDDIEIPEINYRYDAEQGDGGWTAQGFIRHANVLPQRWLVQLITFGKDPTSVERLPIASDQTGRWTIHLGTDVERAVLVVSGLAPVTTEPANYWFAVTEAK